MEHEQLSTEHESAAERVALAAEVLGGEAAASRGTSDPGSAGPSAPRGRFGPAGGAHLERHYSRDPADFADPTSRHELWRFAALPRLRPLLEGPDADGDVRWDWASGAPIERVPMTDPRVGATHTPFDKLGAIAMTKAEDALVVSVTGERPEPIVLTAKGVGGVAYGHLVVDVAPLASAVVVVDHVGRASYAANVELRVGDGARLTYVTVQEWDDDAIHVESQTACVGRDAQLRHVTVSLGGEVVRIAPVVRFAGPGGDATLLGLYFADSGQHVDARLLVDHDQPNCRSRVTYKGALQGEDARSVWTGDVLIRPTATGTDTYELNRNLLLTEGARADSVPNLEIETGEVAGAGHASATGRFDDEQLFYLMARGIPADQARRLVVRGFFADVLAAVGLPDLAARLLSAVDAKLERTIGATSAAAGAAR